MHKIKITRKICMEYIFRKYEASDYEFIYELKKLCYKHYVDELLGGWNEEDQRKMYEDFILERGNDIKILYVNNKLAGFVDGKNKDENSYEQGNICLLPEFRGQGIGSWYLSELIKNHKNQNIYLRVFKSNPAKRLYDRMGFEIYDETPSHYLMVRAKEKC